MTYYVHIHQQKIQQNTKKVNAGITDDLDPPIVVKKNKSQNLCYAHEIKVKDATLVYDPSGQRILSCGARLVLTTETQPEIVRWYG